jgi:uncharacterized membrane protein
VLAATAWGADADAVLSLFKATCAACHTPEAEKVGGGFDYVLDLGRVAANPEYIVPGKPEESELFLVIAEGDMPPRESGLAPVDEQGKETVKRWIALDAPAPAAAAAAPAASAEPVPLMDRVLRWVGNLHMPAVHFPIALLLCAALAELFFMVSGRESFMAVLRFCLWFGFLAALPAAAFGWARAEHGVFVGATKEWTLWWHRWLGVGVVGWAFVTSLVNEVRLRWEGPRSRFCARAALIAGAALVAATGAFGGALVFGWDHYAW